MLCSLSSSLGTGELESIRQLEQELGTPLLSFSCHNFQPARLDQDQLAKVQALESKLGVALVAVQG